ncbi:hypothetical protein CMUS01_15232 [Colletotrichum musicola]|uniref:NADAR domain-containing protein n=1 Tax=Colletotrichum musicola TaxID=2175873 RepID=A0A8H6IXW0_9PEZI|nr:hypothetical protein CMUS01_15232 [Colletotrichum musicola]
MPSSKASKKQKAKNPPPTAGDAPVFFFMPNEEWGEFCQWHRAVFTISKEEISNLVGHVVDDEDPYGSVTFTCAEQFMIWDMVKSAVVEAGNVAKFGQNPHLARTLLSTGNRQLCEAASKDRVWGIGYTAKHAMAHQDDWGENLLGKALMAARERLRTDEGEAR